MEQYQGLFMNLNSGMKAMNGKFAEKLGAFLHMLLKSGTSVHFSRRTD